MVQPGLPHPMDLLLQAIAADDSSADLALMIIALTPDYVEKHLVDLRIQHGSGHPQVARLLELLEETKAAISTEVTPVHKQHVISRALLSEFCEIEHVKTGKQLNAWDLERKLSRPKTPGAVGYVRDFVPIDTRAIEALWQGAENRLPAAIQAAKDGSLFSKPDLAKVIRDAIALHFARSPVTLQIHRNNFEQVMERQIPIYANNPALVDEAFRRKYGFHPHGTDAKRLGAEAAMEHMRKAFQGGVLFRFRVEEIYRKARERCAQYGLEIVLLPDTSETEFLLGDTPALTYNAKTGDAGVLSGVAFDTATTVFLPLGPRVLAALGPKDAIRTVPDSSADFINRLQVQVAREKVYYRLGADFSTQLRIWRP